MSGGDDKTAIMFTTAHKPGALAEVLDVFKENGINLTDIEKRPSKKVNWEYYFFIDAQGIVQYRHVGEMTADVWKREFASRLPRGVLP